VTKFEKKMTIAVFCCWNFDFEKEESAFKREDLHPPAKRNASKKGICL